jgi:hypothetical protein
MNAVNAWMMLKVCLLRHLQMHHAASPASACLACITSKQQHDNAVKGY